MRGEGDLARRRIAADIFVIMGEISGTIYGRGGGEWCRFGQLNLYRVGCWQYCMEYPTYPNHAPPPPLSLVVFALVILFIMLLNV